MAKTDTIVTDFKINRGTYSKIQENIASIGENELIITTDKVTPIPLVGDANKVIKVDSTGEYVLADIRTIVTQDLTTNTAGTLSSANWTTLKSSHYYEISSPTMTGLSADYPLVDIKLSIDSNNQIVKLSKNTTNKYSGLFFIEESTNLYEITVYYNGSKIVLRCATVY